MLGYCQLDLWEQIPVKFEWNYNKLHTRKSILKRLQWRPFYSRSRCVNRGYLLYICRSQTPWSCCLMAVPCWCLPSRGSRSVCTWIARCIHSCRSSALSCQPGRCPWRPSTAWSISNTPRGPAWCALEHDLWWCVVGWRWYWSSSTSQRSYFTLSSLGRTDLIAPSDQVRTESSPLSGQQSQLYYTAISRLLSS